MSADWRSPASWDAVCRRSAGRRHYNAARKNLKRRRRAQVLVRLMGQPRYHGLQARLAREFGVSPATISRDFRAIRDADRGALLA